MEKYVIPPIFNLDFKFPASFLLLQHLRQVQKSQLNSQPFSLVSTPHPAGRRVARAVTNGDNSSRPAGPPRRLPFVLTARRPASCRERERDVSSAEINKP